MFKLNTPVCYIIVDKSTHSYLNGEYSFYTESDFRGNIGFTIFQNIESARWNLNEALTTHRNYLRLRCTNKGWVKITDPDLEIREMRVKFCIGEKDHSK